MTKKLPTISIKGKAYVMVKDRIMAFNESYPNGSIITEMVKNEGEVVFKATVYPDIKNKDRAFIGHSEAIRGVSQGITGQSPIEVAETSAVGRALAMLGIGIIESVASADEILKPKIDSTVKLGVCETCGKTARISYKNDKNGRQYCPDWKIHKEKGEASNIIFPPEPLSEGLQEFSDSLD